MFEVEVHSDEFGVLFHGLFQEPAFLLDDKLNRSRASKTVLRGFQHRIFLSETSDPTSNNDMEKLVESDAMNNIIVPLYHMRCHLAEVRIVHEGQFVSGIFWTCSSHVSSRPCLSIVLRKHKSRFIPSLLQQRSVVKMISI